MDSSSSHLPPSIPVQPQPQPQPQPPYHSMYKNRLQEFAQKASIGVPVYQTVFVEGQPHAPKFHSTVWVGGMSFTSSFTFPSRKAAEQEAAKVALSTLLQRTRDELPSLVNEISPFCKSIINEYAAKLHVERPTYNTVQKQLGGVLPVFTTSLVFNGTSYTGDAARTKKEAEQSAAHAAILTIMGDPSSGTKLIEMIKSKSIFYDALKGKSLPLLQANAELPTANAGQLAVKLDHKDTGVTDCVSDNNEAKVEFPESSKMLSTSEEFQMPKQDIPPEAINVSLQPGSANSVDDGSSSKKRRKNKKKANKKARLESLLPDTAVPMNQVPPCSMVHTTFPMSQVPHLMAQLPVTAVSMNQVPPCSVAQLPITTAPMNQAPSYSVAQ